MWHNVLSGLRNPGQQVLELVFISSQPLDPAAVEQRFAKRYPEHYCGESLQVMAMRK